MSLEEYKGVYIFAQQVDGKLGSIAFELLGKATELSDQLKAGGREGGVTAVVLGSGIGALADELAAYGAEKVIVVDDPKLEKYRTEPVIPAGSSA